MKSSLSLTIHIFFALPIPHEPEPRSVPKQQVKRSLNQSCNIVLLCLLRVQMCSGRKKYKIFYKKFLPSGTNPFLSFDSLDFMTDASGTTASTRHPISRAQLAPVPGPCCRIAQQTRNQGMESRNFGN